MTEKERIVVEENVRVVREKIAHAARAAGRAPEEITLVAATKMNDADRVRAALDCGIDAAGENRVQELLEKYDAHAYDGKPLHFIGTLQTNKVKYLIGKVALIQSVSSVRLGQVIAKEAVKRGVRQDILLEVNIAGEQSKSGLTPSEVEDAVCVLASEPSVCVRGLMAIPPVADTKGKNIGYFQAMHQLFVDIAAKKYDNTDISVLSMGMSGDYEDAIACGATMVRVGSAIFGARHYT